MNQKSTITRAKAQRVFHGDLALKIRPFRKTATPGPEEVHNTMDEKQALRAVQAMKPELVSPCHYNCPAFFTKKYNPADDLKFRVGVEKSGAPFCLSVIQ